MTNIFTRFNRKSIQDRQVDTLIGLSIGLIADGKVDQQEAEMLRLWLQRNQHSENPMILNLLERVEGMLIDNILDADESEELLKLLSSLTGQLPEEGEVTKSATIPLNNPVPIVTFEEKQFIFSGTFAYGTRKDCQGVITKLGGYNAKSVSQSVDYLVIGSYVTDSWIHETFGRKIEKAVANREKGLGVAIISEEHWVESANL
tara:strand:- start:36727 stop:37335 length:609 start_codon:yes stop_codon:yes gene_type:complete